MAFVNVRRILAASPRDLRIETAGGESRYRLADDLVATHGVGHTPAAVLTLEGGDISVERIGGSELPVKDVLGPVYRQVPGGALAVPTGRVFVRFAEGISAAEHEADLQRAGFRLEEVSAYAPNAAWVRAASGEIVAALGNLDRLATVPGVEHLEPQLITESHARR